MPNTPTEILPGLWLGPAPVNEEGEAYDDSNHLADLKAAGVTHVVNCTPAVPFPTAEQLGLGGDVGQCRVGVKDEDAEPIEDYFEEATAFMQEAIEGGGTVYVHCETGKSRSVTIVLAYRVKHCGETLRTAYDGEQQRQRAEGGAPVEELGCG